MSRSRGSGGGASRRSSPLQLLKSPSPLLRHTPLHTNNNNNSDNVQRASVLPALPLPATTADVAAQATLDDDDTDNKTRTTTTGNNKNNSSRHDDMTTQMHVYFSKVELTFQLPVASTRRSHDGNGALYPRDIGSLLLWCVPAPVPLVEAPRAFFVRNRSRVRDVVVVCIRGWSAEMMLCDASAFADGDRKTRRNDDGSSSNATTTTTTTTTTVASASSRRRWSARVCAALLAPVRAGRCWARGCDDNNNNNNHHSASGDGNTSGVQYAPLHVSESTWRTLAQDIFWRYGRAAAASSSSAASSAAPVTTTTDATGEQVSDTTARGVGAVFKRARALHDGNNKDDNKDDGSGSSKRAKDDGKDTHDSTHTDAATATTTATAADATTPSAAHADKDTTTTTSSSAVWRNVPLLCRYALHMPEHAHVFAELGYTLEPVDDEWCRFDDDVTHDADEQQQQEHEHEVQKHNNSSDGHVRGVYALDCEMVLVEGGVSALARGTLIDVCDGHRVVLDMLVKPSQPIVDYVTRYSGVDAAALRDVTTTLRDFQRALRRYVTSRSVLIGHSLENDLRACKVVPSCYVLDTACLYPHPSQLPYKNSLRFLAHRYLGKRIQQGCHDSSEDACVSAELAALKLSRGPNFGLRERVNILDLMCSSNSNNSSASSEAASEASATATRVCARLYDDAAVLQTLLPPRTHNNDHNHNNDNNTSSSSSSVTVRHRIDAVPVRDDEDATRKAVRALRARAAHDNNDNNNSHNSHNNDDSDTFCLTWVQLHEAVVDVTMPPSPSPSLSPSSGPRDHDNDDNDNASSHEQAQLARVACVNDRVLRIIDACRDGTVVLIVTSPPTPPVVAAATATTTTTTTTTTTPSHVCYPCCCSGCGVMGTCFGFVKDCNSRGPSPLPPPTAQHKTHNDNNNDNNNNDNDDKTRTRPTQTTPPACQAQ